MSQMNIHMKRIPCSYETQVKIIMGMRHIEKQHTLSNMEFNSHLEFKHQNPFSICVGVCVYVSMQDSMKTTSLKEKIR